MRRDITVGRGTIFLGLQSILNSGLGFALFMVFARFVDRFEMGLYGGLFLVLSVINIVCILGLNIALARFTPIILSRGDYPGFRALLSKSLIITSSLSLATLAIIYLFSKEISALLFSSSKYSSLVILTGLTSIMGVYSIYIFGVLQGLQEYIRLGVYRILSQLGRVSSTIPLLFIGLGVTAMFIGWLIFYLIFLILGVIHILKFIRIGHHEGLDAGERSIGIDNDIGIHGLLSFSIPILAYTLTIYLSNSMDQYLVLWLLGTEAMGIYTVAITVSSSVPLIVGVPLSITLTPAMSESYGLNGVNGVSTALGPSIRYISIFYTPFCILIASLSPLIVDIVAGSTYLDSVIPLTIVSIGLVASGLSIAFISSLIAIGRTINVGVSAFLASMIELVSVATLIQLFNVVGAALGRLLMYVSFTAILYYYCRRGIREDIDWSTLFKSLLASMGMGLITFTVGYLTGFNMLLSIIYVFISISTYLVFIVLLGGLKLDDLRYLFSLLPYGDHIFKRIEGWVAKHKRINDLLR